MANGALCVRCGFQETEHEHPEYLNRKDRKKLCGTFTESERDKKFDEELKQDEEEKELIMLKNQNKIFG